MLQKIKDFYRTYGYFHIKQWLLNLVVVVALCTIDFKYFLYSLCIYFLYMPLSQLLTHEYASHDYITPKNKWVELFCLLNIYAHDINVEGRKVYHTAHHKLWKDSGRDPTQIKMKNVPIWCYVFGFYRPRSLMLDPVDQKRLSNGYWVKILDKHYRKIYWLFVLACLLLLPLPWFVVICVYLPWLMIVIFSFHDHVFHGAINSKDHDWYLPFFGSQAWHLQHHEKYASWYHGPGIWKWLNLAWYYQLALFRFKKSTIK